MTPVTPRTLHLSFSGLMMALLRGQMSIEELEGDLFALSATWAHLDNEASVVREMRCCGFKGQAGSITGMLRRLRGVLHRARNSTPPRAIMKAHNAAELRVEDMNTLLREHGFRPLLDCGDTVTNFATLAIAFRGQPQDGLTLGVDSFPRG